MLFNVPSNEFSFLQQINIVNHIKVSYSLFSNNKFNIAILKICSSIQQGGEAGLKKSNQR